MKLTIKTKVETTKEIEVDFPVYKKYEIYDGNEKYFRINQLKGFYLVDELLVSNKSVNYSQENYMTIGHFFNERGVSSEYTDSTQEEFEVARLRAIKVLENYK